jgi:quercetin dioxygenase-like cupin family protein
VRHWKLDEIETADGSRSPVVLHSQDGESRAVLIELQPGQELGDHQVLEAAWLLVVDGRLQVSADGRSIDAGPGELFRFEPSERHAVTSRAGARLVLMLAPWPGEGHYRGDQARSGHGAP